MSVSLAFDAFGASGPPLLIMHGLLGMARNWMTIARRLAETHRVYALDLRNHGRSPRDPNMRYQAMAADVVRFIDEHSLGTVRLLGHSMGGKAAMATALLQPERVERLIVADIAPVPYDHGNFADFIRAMQAIDLGSLHRRAEADEALKAAVPDPVVRTFLLLNLVGGADGFCWRPDLDALLHGLPDTLDWPVALDQYQYVGPTLFLTGALSDYVQPAHRSRIESLFPLVRYETVLAAGHWLHAEKPAAFLESVGRFLAE